MIYQFLIVISIYPILILRASATSQTSTATSPKAPTNSTSPPPENTSYFYRDPQGPGTYEFGYHIKDNKTENIQFREERRYANGTVVGSYGHLRPDGKMTTTNYVADEKGYRQKTTISKHQSSSIPTPSATITTEVPGLNLTAATLPPQLVEGVKNQYDIDLSPNALPGDILHPNISDIINGKVPLKKNSSELGFEVVHNFIPSDFPIVPFQLPTEMPHHPIDD